MIVTRWGECLLAIRQTDHGKLSGQLARAWGNATFAPPEPSAAVLLAAALHDIGWEDWEAAPRVNPGTGMPYQFFEMPAGEHLGFYLDGVEKVIARDPYAGLLVSMHCEGLYNQRFGTDSSIPEKRHPPDQQAAIERFRERLHAQQQRLRQDLQRTYQAPFLEDNRIWTNYKLLQVFDRLSLYLCMPPFERGKLGPAPVAVGGDEVRLALGPENEFRVVVTPYPFQPAPLRVTVLARLVPACRYPNDDALRQALGQARAFRQTFELAAAS
jgi:hypothetical protein